jgi:putative two-component system response regulator
MDDSPVQSNVPNKESPSYMELYQKELKRSSALQNELDIIQSQSKTYARELSTIYQQTKIKRKQLSETNHQLVKYASDLRTTISSLKQTNHELKDAYQDTIFRLVLASEYKDKDTGNHINRISRYSTLLAAKLGLLNNEIENIRYGAPMHDVGKIGIPDSIMLKNGMLTEHEFTIIKSHTTIGAVILANSKSPVLQTAKTIALSHHEHWNGNGYPNGLCGDKIPLAARIVSLADTFDALTSKRPYKTPYPLEIACKIILRERNNQFDPVITDIFLQHIDEFVKIKNEIDIEEQTTDNQFSWSERDSIISVN